MNKKIIGSLILTTAPIVAVVSCGTAPTQLSPLGILNKKKEAAVAALQLIEGNKPHRDDNSHDPSLYPPIAVSLTTAIQNVKNAGNVNDVIAEQDAGTRNIKHHIGLYKASSPNSPNEFFTELKKITSLSLTGEIFKMTSTQFFQKIKTALDSEITKYTKLNGTTTTIQKFYTSVNSSKKLIVQYTTNKTFNTRISVEIGGLTHANYSDVQVKTLVRMFSNINEYATLTSGIKTFKYTLAFNEQTITLKYINSKWMLTDPTVNNGVATDITSELTGLTAIGSKMWSYIQTVLLKKVTTFDLVISASTGLPSSISPPTSIDVAAPIN